MLWKNWTMQQLIIIICKDDFFVFDGFEQVFIEGNSSFPYSMNRVKEDLKNLLECLTNQYNLSSPAELNISIIANEDNLITETVRTAFYNQEKSASINNVYEITNIIGAYIKQFSNDKTLYIDDFGVNFDGINYTIRNNFIEKQSFSLLALTVSSSELVKYV